MSRKRSRSEDIGGVSEEEYLPIRSQPKPTHRSRKETGSTPLSRLPRSCRAAHQKSGQVHIPHENVDSEPERLKVDLEVFALKTPTDVTGVFWTPCFPPGSDRAIAVDHEEQKIYLLTADDDEESSTIHCLDMRKKMWENTLHDIKSEPRFGFQPRSLPACGWSSLVFLKDRNGDKYLFIVGGYFGRRNEEQKYSSLNQSMTILAVNIAKKTWNILHTLGSAPRRIEHTAVLLSDKLYVFGGRKKLGNNPDTNLRHPGEDFLESYSVLEFDEGFSIWVWNKQEESYKDRAQGLGYNVQATVLESSNSSVPKIFLSPGFPENDEWIMLLPPNFYIFNPATETFASWKDEHISEEAPQDVQHYSVVPNASVRYNKGSSDTVIFAECLKGGLELYYYQPTLNDSFCRLGVVKSSAVEEDLIEKSEESRNLGRLVTVADAMYILSTDGEHNMDIVARVRLQG
ncbi:hypothetical protein VKT23_019665 [Stygiomarasmius scandens]|uniref:Uncharacterized protein n=1 Tax=Marasmiellus scandens TaxID=2682957 RepID=A0ABR1INQ4_9AGAR